MTLVLSQGELKVAAESQNSFPSSQHHCNIFKDIFHISLSLSPEWNTVFITHIIMTASLEQAPHSLTSSGAPINWSEPSLNAAFSAWSFCEPFGDY